MKHSSIVPAIIPNSFDEVVKYAKQLAFSHELQLDLVDGKFTPTTSWPYEPAGDPMSVKKYLDPYTLEIDLMVSLPVVAANEWIKAGADMLVFHVETLSLEAFKTFTMQTNVSIGVSAHGETSLDKLSEYAEYADYIQLMGINEIGSQRQPFDESVLDKIAVMKKRFPFKHLTIDGSVNSDTIARLKKAGANRFICGSAIVLQPDPEAVHLALAKLINE